MKMRMMLLSLMLAMVVSFSACGSKEAAEEVSEETVAEAEVEPVPEEITYAGTYTLADGAVLTLEEDNTFVLDKDDIHYVGYIDMVEDSEEFHLHAVEKNYNFISVLEPTDETEIYYLNTTLKLNRDGMTAEIPEDITVKKKVNFLLENDEELKANEGKFFARFVTVQDETGKEKYKIKMNHLGQGELWNGMFITYKLNSTGEEKIDKSYKKGILLSDIVGIVDGSNPEHLFLQMSKDNDENTHYYVMLNAVDAEHGIYQQADNGSTTMDNQDAQAITESVLSGREEALGMSSDVAEDAGMYDSLYLEDGVTPWFHITDEEYAKVFATVGESIARWEEEQARKKEEEQRRQEEEAEKERRESRERREAKQAAETEARLKQREEEEQRRREEEQVVNITGHYELPPEYYDLWNAAYNEYIATTDYDSYEEEWQRQLVEEQAGYYADAQVPRENYQYWVLDEN